MFTMNFINNGDAVWTNIHAKTSSLLQCQGFASKSIFRRPKPTSIKFVIPTSHPPESNSTAGEQNQHLSILLGFVDLIKSST
mmetsp:Transcript_33125/g.67625  ORF Transcript_33125/g.67625 Transcript_33125/m.67625 type:complete len:82 (-) Transcript_33125:211-456(-)